MSRADHVESENSQGIDSEVVSLGVNLLPRQRVFAEIYAPGDVAAGRAYEQAGFKARGASADSAAARLLQNVEVASYVRALREAAAKFGAAKAILSIREKREYLARLVRTPIGNVDVERDGENGDLCQEVTRVRRVVGGGEDAEEWEVEKMKVAGKLEAIKLDSVLAGELNDNPKRGDVNVSVNVVVPVAKLEEIQRRRAAALNPHGRN